MYLNNGALLKNGEYRIEKVLAAGGFGITYLAMQVALGRKVAVKEFFMKEHCNRDSGNSYVSVPSVGSKEQVEHFKEKFLKEARLIASFDHSNIIRIHDVFEENGTAYYVMEYLEGESLSTLVARCGAIDEQVALRYTRQVADALAEVHAGNLLHLDVKPANIMLNKKGEAVLIDFGISKHYDETGSQTSSAAVGISEGYAPLEQYEAGALSSFTPATDVYSLGATLYFLVTGQRPPKAGDVMNDGLPVLPSDVSPEVSAAIEAAMQPRRKERPQSVAEFLSLLESTDNRVQRVNAKAIEVDKEETRAVEKEIEQPTAKNNEPSTPKKNRTLLVVMVVALLGILIGGGLFFAFSGSDNRDDRRIVRSEDETDAFDEYEQGISTQKKVDLGLSVYWAGWNVGASSPEEYGDYFAWGETVVKSDYTWDTYKWKDGRRFSFTKYCTDSEYGDVDNKVVLDNSDDVACVKWGGEWRMPTVAEFRELYERCTFTQINYKGVVGYKFTGPNGNSIFLPNAGYYYNHYYPVESAFYEGGRLYWSKSLCKDHNSSGWSCTESSLRENALPVRPVCDK